VEKYAIAVSITRVYYVVLNAETREEAQTKAVEALDNSGQIPYPGDEIDYETDEGTLIASPDDEPPYVDLDLTKEQD
jgi:hypothetical protein